MFADYHVHSHFSEDTDFPMEIEIQKAIKLGMDELCFTEHSDYDVPTVVIRRFVIFELYNDNLFLYL